jgi:hypothetical protein
MRDKANLGIGLAFVRDRRRIEEVGGGKREPKEDGNKGGLQKSVGRRRGCVEVKSVEDKQC